MNESNRYLGMTRLTFINISCNAFEENDKPCYPFARSNKKFED